MDKYRGWCNDDIGSGHRGTIIPFSLERSYGIEVDSHFPVGDNQLWYHSTFLIATLADNALLANLVLIVAPGEQTS
jgi:hypothetical protein